MCPPKPTEKSNLGIFMRQAFLVLGGIDRLYFEPHIAVLKAYSLLCVQGQLLAVIREP